MWRIAWREVARRLLCCGVFGEVSLAIDTGLKGSVMVPRNVCDRFLVAELLRSLGERIRRLQELWK